MASHTTSANPQGAPDGVEKGRALAAAEERAQDEKAMTLRETFKVYRKAIGWSLVVSTALIMEGYDLNIVSERLVFANAKYTDQ